MAVGYVLQIHRKPEVLGKTSVMQMARPVEDAVEGLKIKPEEWFASGEKPDNPNVKKS